MLFVHKFTKCLKIQPCDVIQMREMRGEEGKKTPKKEMDNPSFLWRRMSDFWVTLSHYLGCYTRFSCSLINKNSQLAEIKITTAPIHPLYHLPFHWLAILLIIEFYISNLNWLHFPPTLMSTYILYPLFILHIIWN